MRTPGCRTQAVRQPFCVQKSPRSVPGEKAIPENRQIFRNCVPTFARFVETFRQSLAHLPIDSAPQQGIR